MATLAFPIEDAELLMPNGEELMVVNGDLPVTYRGREWEPDFSELTVIARNDEGCDLRLTLPLRHPALRNLMNRLDNEIAGYCGSNW